MYYVVLTIGFHSRACHNVLHLRTACCGVPTARSERMLLLERASASSRSTHSSPARFGAASITEKREHEPGSGRRGAGDVCDTNTRTGCRQAGAAAAVAAAAAAAARLCAAQQATLLPLRARALRSRAHSGVVFMA